MAHTTQGIGKQCGKLHTSRSNLAAVFRAKVVIIILNWTAMITKIRIMVEA